MPLIVTIPRPPPPLQPDEVANLFSWYDFSDISTLWQNNARTTPVTADGDTIAGVTDKSGNNKDLLQSGNLRYTTSGQNGLSTGVVDAQGSPQVFTGGLRNVPPGLSLPITYFIAATSPHDETISTILDHFGCGGQRFVYAASAGDVIVFHGTTLITTLPFSTFLTVTIEAPSGDDTNVYNNTNLNTTGDAGSGGQNHLSLGLRCDSVVNTGAVKTHFGEIIAYEAVLSAADRQGIQKYLRDKWGT